MTTNTTMTNVRADDALKYAVALLEEQTEWALDSIGGSTCNYGGHEDELDSLHAALNNVRALAAQYGDPRRYSDGRAVKTSREITRDLVTSHVWHPVAVHEEPESWGAALPSDPDVPSPGFYEVTTEPLTQRIHVCVVEPLGIADTDTHPEED